MNQTTLQIDWPQWQGGMNPNYRIGNDVLSAIVPYQSKRQSVAVPVANQANALVGVAGGAQLQTQMTFVHDKLTQLAPQRVITLGGDCSVSEVPFDYLHGRYPDNFGVIWLDAHPDISTIADSHHLHEMVVADLLQKSGSVFAKKVQHPFRTNQVYFSGLQTTALRPMDQLVQTLNMNYATPKMLRQGTPVTDWLVAHQIQHVAIHFDLDVLDPDDFRSILPAQPHLDRRQFGAAIGALQLSQAIQLLVQIGNVADIVGLTLAEHMPWDAIRLQQGLSQLSIFN